jgi:hypothetical protein
MWSYYSVRPGAAYATEPADFSSYNGKGAVPASLGTLSLSTAVGNSNAGAKSTVMYGLSVTVSSAITPTWYVTRLGTSAQYVFIFIDGTYVYGLTGDVNGECTGLDKLAGWGGSVGSGVCTLTPAFTTGSHTIEVLIKTDGNGWAHLNMMAFWLNDAKVTAISPYFRY